jgi:hypothetical protein
MLSFRKVLNDRTQDLANEIKSLNVNFTAQKIYRSEC